MPSPGMAEPKMYVVEHLDPELGPWSALEYHAIAEETSAAGGIFVLSSVPKGTQMPESLRNARGFIVDHRSIEDQPEMAGSRMCLLDPAASTELSPEDANKFDLFIFGGILGKNQHEWMREPMTFGIS